jgi:hypothetical protein
MKRRKEKKNNENWGSNFKGLGDQKPFNTMQDFSH